MPQWNQVTRQAFYAVIGPQNVQCDPQRMEALWKLHGGQVIGKSKPGYLCRDDEGRYTPEKTYYLPA